MIEHLIAIAPVVALAFAAAVATLPIAIVIGRKLGITAHPAVSLVGAQQTVEFGGAPIIGAILIALALLHQLPLWITAGAGGLLIVGMIDDAIELRPYQKFICQIAICAWAVVFALPDNGLTLWWSADCALALLWLLATTNAFNLIDGLDGLAAGIGIIAAVTIAATGIMHQAPQVWMPSLAIAGSLCAFMLFNFPPARIFMGDAGALPIGYLLGGLALAGGELATNSRLTKYVFPVLIMIVPLLDTGIVSVTRLATGTWISRHGSDHSHHRLLSLGLTDRAAVAVCCAVAAVGALCGFAANVLTHENVIVALPFLVLATAVLALFMMDLTFESNAPGLAYGYVQGVARFILRLGYKQRIAEAAVDFALISGAFLAAQALRLDFNIDSLTIGMLLREVPYVALATYPAFVIAGVYRGIWRYTSLSDGLRFANGAVLAGVFVTIAARFALISLSGSIVVLFVILLFNLLMMTRISFQAIRKGISQLATANERVLVVGAGEQGAAAANFIFSSRRHSARVIGFVDDDKFKLGKLMHGQRVLGNFDDLERIYQAAPFQELLLATDGLSIARMGAMTAFTERHGIALRRFSIQVNEMAGSPAAAMPQAHLAGSMRVQEPNAV
jgi:UDP-GlcNAc:undecaprenyl-phosphate GlcNAc-1-phosphate transferase